MKRIAVNLIAPVRWVVRGLAICFFTLLEILGLPRVPREKAKRGSDQR
jgi:hypothetical protein